MSLKRTNKENILDLYDINLRGSIWSGLESLGFSKKSKTTFYRVENNFLQIISFNRSWTKNQFNVDLIVHFVDLPVLFEEELIFTNKPRKGCGHIFSRLMTNDDYKKNLNDHVWVIPENELAARKKFKEVLDCIKNNGLVWLDRVSDFREIKRIYETEKDKLLTKYQVGVWADLIGAISYEMLGNKKKAFSVYKPIYDSDYIKNLGRGVKKFIHSKLKQKYTGKEVTSHPYNSNKSSL